MSNPNELRGQMAMLLATHGARLGRDEQVQESSGIATRRKDTRPRFHIARS